MVRAEQTMKPQESPTRHRLVLAAAANDLEVMEMGVPLLLVTNDQDEDSPENKKQALTHWAQFSARLGCAIGYAAPFVIIGTTLLIVVACTKLGLLDLTAGLIRGLIVTVTVISSQMIYFCVLPRNNNNDGDTMTALEFVKFQFSLGALTGALVCWFVTCLVLGFNTWDQVGLVTGSLVVIYYYENHATLESEEEEEVNDSVTKPASVVVV